MVEAYTVRLLSPMRKVIASRMAESTRTIPHFRLTADVEVDALVEVRREVRDMNPAVNLSLNDLVIKACAMALMDVPAVNIQWSDNGILYYNTADISVVTAIDGGLSTPIIRGAEKKSVLDISREVKGLAMRAATHSLKMEEVFGGSFSISNLGMHGVDQFDAIINPPQCAILAIGSAKPRVVVSQDRETRIATVMRVTLSVDHRAIDGAIGAAFLTALKHRLEHPASLSENNKDGAVTA